jgi:hypothetical protein
MVSFTPDIENHEGRIFPEELSCPECGCEERNERTGLLICECPAPASYLQRRRIDMSWSVSAIGKPTAVAAKLADAFTKNPCAEPEETIRQGVASAIAVALKSFDGTMAVRVDASGSQSTNNGVPTSNQLSVKIEPIYGFVE